MLSCSVLYVRPCMQVCVHSSACAVLCVYIHAHSSLLAILNQLLCTCTHVCGFKCMCYFDYTLL